MPQFSICIAAMSADCIAIDQLKSTLESISLQVGQDCEIVASLSDDYAAYCCQTNPAIKICSSATSRTEARDACLRAATGDLIMILEPGARLLPESLKRFARAFALYDGLSMAIGRAKNITADGLSIDEEPEYFEHGDQNTVLPGRTIAERAMRSMQDISPLSAVCFRREVSADGFARDLRLYADFDFLIRLALAGYCLYLPHSVVQVVSLGRVDSDNLDYESLSWLIELIQLHDKYQDVAIKNATIHDDEVFDKNWHGTIGAAYLALSAQLDKRLPPYDFKADRTRFAIKNMDWLDDAQKAENYGRLAAILARMVANLNWWKGIQSEIANKAMQTSYQNGYQAGLAAAAELAAKNEANQSNKRSTFGKLWSNRTNLMSK